MPTETVPSDASDVVVEDQGSRRRGVPLRRPTRAEALAWTGDAVSLLLLAGVLLWWEMHDGGRNRPHAVAVAVLALVTAPVVLAEARRVGPRFAILLGAYGLGWLGALAFAVDRHDWIDTLVVLALVPYVGLAARRIWRRPWGPTVLVVLLLLAFGRYTYRSWLQWWGNTMRGSQPLWMPLSWRNQSGALMGTFGVLFLGIAWCSRRVVRIGLALLAGTALAGVWLSSSRGAIVFTAAATVVMLVVALRSLPSTSARIGVVVTTVGAACAAAVLSLLLVAMLPAGSSTPIESREEAASQNAGLRFRHMEAALRMFGDRPLVGQGPGSYGVMALDFTDPDANLTTSAHDEYVEVLGEGGLLGGVPFLLLHLGIGVLVWRRLRHGVVLSHDPLVDLRGAVTVGAVGVVVLIAGHTAFDFDWHYPVLPSLLAIGAGILSVRPGEIVQADAAATPLAEASPPPTSRRWPLLAASPLVLLLAVSLAGHVAERRLGGPADDLDAEAYAAYGAPWDAELRAEIVATLLNGGELELARGAADEALAWNPGIDKLRRLHAMVRYEQGELDAAGLVATLEEGRSRFTSYVDIADRLIAHGEFEHAAEVLDEVQEQMARYANWGVNETVMDVGRRQIVVAGELDGCAAAREQADEVRTLPVMDHFADAEAVVEHALAEACA